MDTNQLSWRRIEINANEHCCGGGRYRLKRQRWRDRDVQNRFFDVAEIDENG